MILPESDGQFIAFIIKVYDIHFQTFFKLFSFCCSFRPIVTFFHQGHIQFFVFQKNNVSTDFICHQRSVCWTICVFINVF